MGTITLKNEEILAQIEHLKHLLERRDRLGYAAAVNTRRLSENVAEYLEFRNELIKKYGEQVFDDNGNQTGEVVVRSDKAQAFFEELKPVGDIEHEINIIKIPMEDAIGALSGQELLDLWWMFEEE